MKRKEGWCGAKGHDFEVYKENETVYRRFDESSCFIFGKSKFRKAIINLTEWSWFEQVTTGLIVINSVLLCFYDNSDRFRGPGYVSNVNRYLDKLD